ncbi:condensation domain-containing protein [Kitasatospora sp. NPDC097643]|uniref:condensation domain-containing protein n=1 Tax=Kitasatospora sp. NPDC097643 TaxID=3157230 RepID=UPI00331BFF46
MTVAETHPLSIGQESVWLHQRLAPDSTAYSMAVAVRVRTPLDDALLDRAVREVARRHVLLRSVFREENGTPRRVPLSDGGAPLEVRELGPVTVEELRTAVGAAHRIPFDLAAAPPWRVVLLRRTPDDAVLLLVVHHLVSDAITLWILLRELLDAHQGLRTDGTPLLPEPVADYQDHVTAQRELLATPRGERMARYWRALRESAVPSELPTDRPRPPVQALAGASLDLPLPAGLGERAIAAAHEAGVSVFALLLGVFQSLVSRWTGAEETMVACLASNRTVPSARRMVGYLVNPVLLRARTDRRTTWREAAVAAHHEVLQAMANVACPSALPTGHAGSAGRGPLARLAFTLYVTDRQEPRLPYPPAGTWEGAEAEYRGLRLALLDMPQAEGVYDLGLEVRQTGDTLTACVRYDSTLFESATIESFVAAYGRLAEAALSDLEAPVAATALVDPAEARRLLDLGTGRAHAPLIPNPAK